MRNTLKLAVLLAALSASCVFADEDDGHAVLYYKGAGSYWSDKKWATTSSGSELCSWSADAIAVITAGNINFPKSSNVQVHKIKWNNSTYFLNAGTGALNLGAGGIELFGSNDMRCRNWTGNNKLNLTASQTWTNTTSSTRTIHMLQSNYRPSSSSFILTAEDDILLTVAGMFTWTFSVQTALTNADVKIVSPAVLAVVNDPSATPAKFNARNLILDGSASTLASSAGAPCLMAKTLKLRNGGKLTVNSGLTVGIPLDGVAGKIVVDAGTGTLAGVVRATESGEAFPLEVAEGATLVVSATLKESPRFVVSGAGTIKFASGIRPDLEFADGFTGKIELSGSQTISVVYPESFDMTAWTNRYSAASGTSFTLRYMTPRAPVVYTNGIDLMTGITDESLTNGWSFAYYSSERSTAYPAQGVFRTLEDGMVRVYPIDPPRQLTSSTDKNFVTWENRVWVDSATGTTGTWSDGAVATLSAKNTTIASDVTIGGLRWDNFNSYFSAPGYNVHLGGHGVFIDRTYSATTGFRAWKMRELRLVAPQDWECSTAYNAYVCIGDSYANYPSQYPTLFSADADANMTLKGPIYLCLNCPGDFHESDIALEGSATASGTLLYIDYSKWGDRDVMLNARTLTIGGRSTVYARQATRVEGGYAIAQKVVFASRDGYTPTLSFDATTAAGTRPYIDVGAIETSGEGAGLISGTAILPEWQIPVMIAAGTTLRVGSVFSNASSRSGALVLSGAGTWLATATSANAYVFDDASVAGFEGDVVVTNGAVLNLSGAVDVPSLVLRDGAMVRFKLDRGDKIADMSKVVFPESGSVKFHFYRDDAIAQSEGSLDCGMDFSAVSAADLAKLVITVEDREGSSPYSVTATPRVDRSGRLFADLSSSMSKKNGTFGGMLWTGTDWGDATDPQNWVIYPNGTTAANYNPDNHPSDTADALSKMQTYSIYCSANWRLNLGGLTWSSPDSRNNDASDESFVYGVSNGTWNASTMLIPTGTVLVENGAVFIANGYKSGDDHWNLGTGATKASPFLFNVRAGGRAVIGHRTVTINSGLYNVRYQVDAGGSLAYYLKPTFVNKACTTFANDGVLSFPYGFALVNSSQATTGELAVVQSAGTLHLNGAFSLAQGEGCGSKAGFTLAGGTTVVSNGTTFVGWRLALAEDGLPAVEIPEGGDFATDIFSWGEGAALEKRGAGLMRLAVTDEVSVASIKISEGVLVTTGTNMASSLNVEFAGGTLGVGGAADGDVAEYGLLITNGIVTGGCRVRNLVGRQLNGVAVPFLTVAAASDPGWFDGDVAFEKPNGAPADGTLVKDSVDVGGVECVRYSCMFKSKGGILVVW